MSRIGRLPIVVPPKVEVHVDGTQVRVKGPKGTLEYTFPADISIAYNNGVIEVKRLGQSNPPRPAWHHACPDPEYGYRREHRFRADLGDQWSGVPGRGTRKKPGAEPWLFTSRRS